LAGTHKGILRELGAESPGESTQPERLSRTETDGLSGVETKRLWAKAQAFMSMKALYVQLVSELLE
jgi:hypothetical protein